APDYRAGRHVAFRRLDDWIVVAPRARRDWAGGPVMQTWLDRLYPPTPLTAGTVVRLRAEYTDRFGASGTAFRQISVREDGSPPRIRIDAPDSSHVKYPNLPVELAFRVTDEAGVAAWSVRINGGLLAERVLPAPSVDVVASLVLGAQWF